MALVVAGVVLGLGVPSFMNFQRSNAMTAAANDLVSGLLTARTEAIKRQLPVTLCTSPNPTAAAPGCGAGDGFIVFVDEDDEIDANGAGVGTHATDGNAAFDAGEPLLLQSEAPGGAIDVFRNGSYVSYGANGLPRQPAGHPDPPATAFLYCDDRGNRLGGDGQSSARLVVVEPTGRAQVRLDAAQIRAAADAMAGGQCPGA